MVAMQSGRRRIDQSEVFLHKRSAPGLELLELICRLPGYGFPGNTRKCLNFKKLFLSFQSLSWPPDDLAKPSDWTLPDPGELELRSSSQRFVFFNPEHPESEKRCCYDTKIRRQLSPPTTHLSIRCAMWAGPNEAPPLYCKQDVKTIHFSFCWKCE